MLKFRKLCLMAVAAVIAVTSLSVASDAGPIRNFLARRAEVRAERRAERQGSCSAAYGNSACAACGTNCACAAPGMNGACMDATCDAAAEKAFREADVGEPAAYAGKGFGSGGDPRIDNIPDPNIYRQGVSGPLVDRVLAAREARLGLLEKIAFNRLKDRPDLRKKVAAYAAARGVSIDPNNLAQILDVLLQFFQKLLPLILQFVYHQPVPIDGPYVPMVYV